MEALEQITINIGIEDFRCRFATLVGKTSSEIFEVPITGDMTTNEYFGTIDVPEFYATLNGPLTDNLYIENIVPQMEERSINSTLYQSITHVTNLYPITGSLQGQLYEDQCIPFKCSGIVSGELTYHTLDNVENSPTWEIAPQVGDYFILKCGEIEEQYEITQLFDRVLTNQGGINPLLGKYIFQCQAVRRSPSHEEFKQEQDPILDELNDQAGISRDLDTDHVPEYSEENSNCQDTNLNQGTNRIAKNIYDYIDNADYTYGGYNTYPADKTKTKRDK